MELAKLTNLDVSYIVRHLPSVVRRLLENHSDVFAAGGFIRSIISREKVNDLDLFTTSKGRAKELATWVATNYSKYEELRIHASENTYSLRIPGGLPIQFIHRWTFNRPEECIESFDFTIARAAIWHDGGGWQSCCHPEFYADLAAKRLVYCSPIRNEDAGGSILRVLKFYQRGYRITLPSLGATIARLIHGVNNRDSEPEVAREITKLLREVDPPAPLLINVAMEHSHI